MIIHAGYMRSRVRSRTGSSSRPISMVISANTYSPVEMATGHGEIFIFVIVVMNSRGSFGFSSIFLCYIFGSLLFLGAFKVRGSTFIHMTRRA